MLTLTRELARSRATRMAFLTWSLLALLSASAPAGAREAVGLLAHPAFWVVLALVLLRPWRWQRSPRPRPRRLRRGAQALRRARGRAGLAQAA